MADAKASTTLKTIDRALDVLEIVARSPDPILVRNVSDQLGHNLSSTYHIVNTLLARRFLARDERGGLTIGERVGALNASLVRNADLEGELRGHIARLAADSGETVYLTRYQHGAVVIQMVVESKQSLTVKGLSVGYAGAEDLRASGKAVLAHLSPTELSQVLMRLHPIGASSGPPASLQNELSAIKEEGFAFDDEDYEPGVCCLSVPYFSADGSVAGSVTASVPAMRVARLRSEIRQQLVATAESISRSLA
jgi:DNA-binding IclR family transcriptional regulator